MYPWAKHVLVAVVCDVMPFQENPAGIRARRFALRTSDGQRYWRITEHACTDDAGVMRRMVDGVPAIAWIGFGDFTPIAP